MIDLYFLPTKAATALREISGYRYRDSVTLFSFYKDTVYKDVSLLENKYFEGHKNGFCNGRISVTAGFNCILIHIHITLKADAAEVA